MGVFFSKIRHEPVLSGLTRPSENKTLRQNVMAMFINPKPKVSVQFFMIHILKNETVL